MRLLTHNMLSSNIKGVTNGFPLRLEVEKVVEKLVEFNADFLKNLFLKIDWKALVDGSRAMGYADLPDQAEPSTLDSEEFLKKFHHALLELHLEEGALICPETGRRFSVNKGIPNMLLHEGECRSRGIIITAAAPMANDAVFGSSLVWLEAIVMLVGAYTLVYLPLRVCFCQIGTSLTMTSRSGALLLLWIMDDSDPHGQGLGSILSDCLSIPQFMDLFCASGGCSYQTSGLV